MAELIIDELVHNTPEFMFEGSCTSDELTEFYPIDIFSEEQLEEVMKVCEGCPVLKECRAYFNEINDEGRRHVTQGVFGGQDYGTR